MLPSRSWAAATSGQCWLEASTGGCSKSAGAVHSTADSAPRGLAIKAQAPCPPPLGGLAAPVQVNACLT